MEELFLSWDKARAYEDGSKFRARDLYHYTVYFDNTPIGYPRTRKFLMDYECGVVYVTVTDRDGRESKPSERVYSCIWSWR